MLKSIGAFVFVRSREVVRFWEGPLREVPLYMLWSHACTVLFAEVEESWEESGTTLGRGETSREHSRLAN